MNTSRNTTFKWKQNRGSSSTPLGNDRYSTALQNNKNQQTARAMSTTPSTRRPFELVRIQELEQSFQDKPSKEELETMATTFNIPSQYIVHEIVFAAPECRLTTEYINWLNRQPIQQDRLEVRTMTAADYIAVHGQDSITKFYRTMLQFGHPYQPVRVIRDARKPKPSTLNDTLTYVADNDSAN